MKNHYRSIVCVLILAFSISGIQARSVSSITGNTAGSDQTICSNTIPVALTGSIPGGGNGVFGYQWQVSSTSATAGYANIGAATGQGYAPGTLTANRWYRRIVTSGVEKDSSNTVQITVTPVITANTVSIAQTICYNSIPAALTGSNPAGGNGSFIYQWQSSPDNISWSNIPGAALINYAPGPLTANTWYRRMVSSGGCSSTSASIKMTVTPVIGNNGIIANQSICSGQTPLALTGSTLTGGTGSFGYLWQSSTTSSTSVFATATGVSNGKNYSPPALGQTTWYRRVVVSGGCSDTTAPVQITVVSSIPGDPTVFGNNQWNVYAYGDNSFTTYAGYYTESALSFATTTRYTTGQSPSTASGYQGCLVAPTNFSVSMKRTNFTPGDYQIDLSALDDNIFLLINGVQVYTKTCCVTPPTSLNNIWTGYLGATDQVEIRWIQNAGAAQLGLNFTVVSPTPLVPGTVSKDLSVCYGEAPSTGFTNLLSPSGGCTLTGMQWQKSLDSVTWTPIAGATALTYTETAALTQTTWYRRAVTDACNRMAATSPVKVAVNVVPPGDPNVYGTSAWNVYVYQGTSPFSSATYKGWYTEPLLSFDSRNRWASGASPSNASGYQGCYVAPTNHWVDYKRTGFTPAIYQIDIPGHDDDAYLFINGIQVFVHNGCCDAHVNVWTGPLGATDQVEYRVSQGGGGAYQVLTLTPVTPAPLTAGTITPDQSICAGNVPPTPLTQSAAPTGGCTISNYQWEYSNDNGVTWNTIAGAIASNYTITGSVYSATVYHRIVYDVCGNSATSNSATVSMNSSAPGDPTVFGNNNWNVYCYQDVNYTLYAGYYTEPQLTFATTTRYPSSVAPSTASGYQGCQLINTYYSVSMKRTGFTAGLYQIDVTADDDYNSIYINGALVSSLTYPTIQNNVWTGNLSPADKIEIRWRNNAGPGATGVRFTLMSTTPLVAGSVAAYNPNLCAGDIPVINEVAAASGGCFVNYSWQSSTDGGTTWTTMAGATGNSYTATVSPTSNIQYRRVAADVCGSTVYSVPVSFVQTAGAIGSPSVYGNGVWNVYAYNANGTAFSTAVYRGYYVEPLLSFSSLNRWGTNNAPSDASGYQGCQTDQENHWISYRRTNFTPGTYQIDVTAHDDDGYLFINGAQVWVHIGCCDTHSNVWTGTLGASDQVEFRWREFNGGSNGGLNFTLVTPSTAISGGTVGATQTICSNTIPVALTSTADAASNCFFSYQWQSSPDGTTWTDVTGATGNVYAPSALTAKTLYRRKAVNACGITAYSNTVTINVYSTALTGGTISANQILCGGAAAASLASTGLPTGGDGNYVYQWQSSLDNIGWSNIASATGTTYSPGALTTTTYFRRNVSACGAAASASSNVISVTVNQLPAIAVQPANASACLNGSTSISVSATGTGIAYQWQVNTGSSWANVSNASPYSGATSSSLAISPVPVSMNGYQYRVIVSGTCTPPVTSTAVTLTVGTAVSISAQPVNASACVGSTVTIPVTASGTGLTYQWQQKIGAGAWTSLTNTGIYSGTTTSALTLTGVLSTMNNYSYQCILGNSCGSPVTSGIAVLTVVAAINNTISTDQAICLGSTAANLTGTSNGSYTYAWQTSTVSNTTGFVTASGVNNGSGYAPNPLATTTYYRRLVSNAGCSSASNVVTISFNTMPTVISTQPVAQTICAGGTAVYSVAATGSGTLSYQWYENNLSTWTAITDGGLYSGSNTNTLTLTGATAGMNNYRYYVKVISSGCTNSAVNSANALLTTNSAPAVTANTADFTTCAGNNVAINITATGVGLGYQWQFNDGSGWNNLSNYGNYSNVISNSLRISTIAAMNGYQFRCVVTGSCSPFTATSAITTLTVNPPITNNSISNSQTLCAGTPVPFTGSTPTGGNGVYAYQWYQNTGSGNIIIPGAQSSDYLPGALTQTTQFLRQVTSGVCGANNSVAITATILPPTATTDPADVTVCAGSNTSFSVTATGSGLGYQWQGNAGSGWNNLSNGLAFTGTNTATLNVLAPPYAANGSQYRVIVGGGCTPVSITSNPATLNLNPTPGIVFQPVNVQSCQGSTVSFAISVSGTGLIYQWREKTGAGVFTNITDGGIYTGSGTSTLTLTGISTAMNTNQYVCVITEGSCPVTSAVASLTVNAQPSLVITNPAVICAPATVNITDAAITAGSNLSGGALTYWNDIGFTSPLSNPSAVAVSGTYYIHVATSPACYDVKPVTVNISPVLVNNNISADQTICTGSVPVALTGAAPAGGVGVYTYQWQQSADNSSFTDIPGAVSGGYSPGVLVATIWYRRNVYSGTCSGVSASVKITVVALPVVVITNPAAVCAPATVDITAAAVTAGSTAGLTYTYFTDAAATNPLANANAMTSSGTYYIRGSSVYGCADIEPVVVTINPKPLLLISNPPAVCSPGTVDITAAAVTSGSASGLSLTYFSDASGTTALANANAIGVGNTYYIKATAVSGCADIEPVVVTINPKPVLVITNPAAVCTGYTVDISTAGTTAGSTGGLTYSYFKDAGATVVLPNPASIALGGTYYIRGTSASGCSDIQPVVVTINALPAASISYTGSPYCSQGTAYVSLTGQAGGSYASSIGLSLDATTGDVDLAGSLEGTYTIVYTFSNGTCGNSAFTTLTIKDPKIQVNDPAGVCFPGTVNLLDPAVTAGSEAGLTFNYYQDAGASLPLANPAAVNSGATYYITATSGSTGCISAIKQVTVTILSKPSVTASGSATDICKGSSVTLTAVSPGNSIDWPGAGSGNSVVVAPEDSTSYLAIATSTDGCKDTATVDVAVNPFVIHLKANPDPVLAGTNTTLTTDGNFTYSVLSWSPEIFFTDQNALTQTIVVKDTSKSFTVIAKSDDGCLDTATLFVVVDPNLKDFFIPNSFSPNKDGNNDIFKVFGSSVRDVVLRVYNQWGELISETHDAQSGWDGTWKGHPQPVGVYVYEAKVTFYNNVSIKRKGTVNLIR